MAYRKYISDGYIVAAGEIGFGEAITKEEYDSLLQIFLSKPENQSGYAYALRASDLEWERIELPPEPEPESIELTDEEALAIILGGSEA